jgi:long-chain acyl-CoA synthetase
VTAVATFSDIFRTLGQLAATRRDDIALVSPRGTRTTFGELDRAVCAAATRLRDEGMRRGDPVLFGVRPSVEAIVLVLAAARAGGTIVAVDPGMSASLFAARSAMVPPRFVMAESLLYALSSSGVARSLLRARHLELPQLGRQPGCTFIRVGRWLPGTPRSIDAARLMRPLPGSAVPPVELHPDEPLFIVFTSGTTAHPRAVIHTAGSISAILAASPLISELDASSVVLTDQLHSALPALLAGSRVILPRIGAKPGEMLRQLHDGRVTHAFAVPSDLLRLIVYCEQHSLTFPATLRQLVLGSGPVGRPLLTRLRALLSSTTRVSSVYGLTEMAPVACVELAEKLAWQGDGDLVGSPLPGSRVRIDRSGELFVSGERMCAGYLAGEPLEEVATGDLARLDESGRIVLHGRSKDMIIRGKYNIYPALYEEKIAEIPGVQRGALIGVWDERVADERVVLVVEAMAQERDAARLRQRVERAVRSEALIDSWAIPDEVVVMPLPEAGRSHKIDRAALRRTLSPQG